MRRTQILPEGWLALLLLVASTIATFSFALGLLIGSNSSGRIEDENRPVSSTTVYGRFGRFRE